MQDRFWRWNIPEGSKLEAKVSGPKDPNKDQFSASGFFGLGEAQSKKWTNAALRNGLQEALPQAGTSYVGQIDLTFADASPATVELKVVSPNGTTRGKAYQRTFPGGKGVFIRIHLWLITQTLQAAPGGAGGGS